MTLLRSWVDLGVMEKMRYTAFPKDIALLELHHQIVLYHIRTLIGDAEMQLVYSTSSVDNSKLLKKNEISNILTSFNPL